MTDRDDPTHGEGRQDDVDGADRSGVGGEAHSQLALSGFSPSVPAAGGATLLERPLPPTMEIATGFSTRRVPMGLDGPFELRGGDRLDSGGIAFDLAMDWQPALMRHVVMACDDQRVCGRDWFFLPATLLAGPPGMGRTHIARRVATAAGLPHLVLDASDERLARSGAAPDVPLPLPPLVGMALTRCANPIVSVENVDQADAEVMALICRLVDGRVNGRIVDAGLGAVLDLSAVSWLVQSTAIDALPRTLRDATVRVDIADPDGQDVAFLVIDLIAEAVADFGLPTPAPALVELIVRSTVRQHGQPYRQTSVAQLYSEITDRLSRGGEPSPF